MVIYEALDGQVGSAVSAIVGLRAATWASHQRLEKRLDIKSRFSRLDSYKAHLERMWGFCVAVERSIGSQLMDAALTDYESRRKLPLLTQDLAALGSDFRTVESLAQCLTIPACRDPASAFGCAYVLEGATLGGRTLLPVICERLGLSAERGATFFASYGDRVALMWREFGAALDGWCSSPERRERASVMAVTTFTALDEWLCGTPA